MVDTGGDVALEKYESAIKEYRTMKAQFAKLRYDPFSIGTPDHFLSTFCTEMANSIARALRIQNTVVLLDGIVRNDPKHDFSEAHINLFADIGSLIRQMLSVPLRCESNEVAAKELKVKLARIRRYIIELSSVVASSSQEMPAQYVGAIGVGILGSRLDLAGMELEEEEDTGKLSYEQDLVSDMDDDDDIGGRSVPKFVHGSRVCALLFLQLVEHLALRSVRLYQSWKHCEDMCDTR
jgi:hypothetical protein